MTTNRFDLIVFDLDGTLSNTIGDIAQSYRNCCAEYGYPAPPDLEVTLWVGKGHEVAVNECYNWLRREFLANPQSFPKYATQDNFGDDLTAYFDQNVQVERDAFCKRHEELYLVVGHSRTKLYPGVRQALTRLKASGVKLCVLTNKMKKLTPKVLNFLQLEDYFEHVFSDGDLTNNKPHPEGILRLMEMFNVSDKQKVLMVGDSDNDVRAGLAAQVVTLGLTYGYNYGKCISLSNPTYYSDHFSAVVALNEGVALEDEAFEQLVATLEA